MKRRLAQLPLHTGKAPPWLFKRMTKLAGAVTAAIVEEFGPEEMLRRLSDPLNLVAIEADADRRASAELVREDPIWVLQEVERLTEGPTLFAPQQHYVLKTDVNMKRLKKIIVDAHEKHPEDFQALLGFPGVGPATVRSLSLLAEVIFQAAPSHRDPATPPPTEGGEQQEASGDVGREGQRRWADYSYAHGGKDGTPFPVDRETYDRNIDVLNDAIRRARLGENDKFNALRRLSNLDTESGYP